MLHRVRRGGRHSVDPAAPYSHPHPAPAEGLAVATAFARARMPVAIVHGRDHRIEFANEACRRWLACPSPVGRRLEEVTPGDDRDELARVLGATAVSGTSRVGRSLRLGAYPPDRLFDVTLEPLADPTGAATRVLMHAVDVTDDRAAAHRLHESAELRQAGLDALGAGTFRWEFVSGRLDVDRTLVELLQLGESDADSLDALLARIHSADRMRLRIACQACAEHGGELREGARMVGRDGKVRWLDVRGRTRTGADGRPRELVGACLDVTEACEREQEWNDLMAMLTHELRTPLNAIGGYTSLMLQGIPAPASPPQLEHLRGIDRSYRHLISLVDAVLTRARMGAGKVDYHIQEVTIGRILDDVEPLIEPQRRKKGIRYDASACDRSLTVRADREKVVQILLNLISNSIKFTAAGGQIELRTEVPGVDRCALVVRDTGTGMTPAQLGRVFQPFTQFEGSDREDRRGTGLGMSISREFARGMGGEITGESEAGSGSAFRLWLPVAAHAR